MTSTQNDHDDAARRNTNAVIAAAVSGVEADQFRQVYRCARSFLRPGDFLEYNLRLVKLLEPVQNTRGEISQWVIRDSYNKENRVVSDYSMHAAAMDRLHRFAFEFFKDSTRYNGVTDGDSKPKSGTYSLAELEGAARLRWLNRTMLEQYTWIESLFSVRLPDYLSSSLAVPEGVEHFAVRNAQAIYHLPDLGLEIYGNRLLNRRENGVWTVETRRLGRTFEQEMLDVRAFELCEQYVHDRACRTFIGANSFVDDDASKRHWQALIPSEREQQIAASLIAIRQEAAERTSDSPVPRERPGE